MIEVEIHPCTKSDPPTLIYNAKTDNLQEAINAALKKYGQGNIFVKERGISVGANALEGSQYGQIGHKVENFVSLNTNRVRISAKIIK